MSTIRNFSIARADGATVSGYMFVETGNGFITDTTVQGEHPNGHRSTFRAICNMARDTACVGFNMENGDVVTLEKLVTRAHKMFSDD
jgi:hypothetical protein